MSKHLISRIAALSISSSSRSAPSSMITTSSRTCALSTASTSITSPLTVVGNKKESHSPTCSYQLNPTVYKFAILGYDSKVIHPLPNTEYTNMTKSQSFNMSTATSNLSSTKKENESILAIGPDGKKYNIPWKPLGGYNQPRHAPKLAPKITKARISKLRIMEGKLRQIRHSPWRLNLICQFAAGMTVPDALVQLKFVQKVKAPLIASLIHSTAKNAQVKYGLQPSQLEVAECFATHGTHLKRLKIMGRGRSGKKTRRFSHVRLVLREIDFPLKLITCVTRGERAQWVKRMEIALEEQEKSRVEREELEKLERQVEEMERKRAAAAATAEKK